VTTDDSNGDGIPKLAIAHVNVIDHANQYRRTGMTNLQKF